jgi:hypothetical protein
VFYWTFDVGGRGRDLRIDCGFRGLHAVKVEQKVEHRQEKSQLDADLHT